jgi:Flp pilus assembly protein TadG
MASAALATPERPDCSTADRGRRGRRRGQSLVELTLTMPLMLLLMLGTIDMGRMFFDYIQLRNAVREGAGYGTRFPTETANISERVRDHVQQDNAQLSPADITVQVSCSGACTTLGGNGVIMVSASHTFSPVTTAFLQSYFGVAPFTMTATASMKVMT